MPVVDFARLWLAAEELYDREKSWSAFGAVQISRWLVRATVRPANGRKYLADSPVTNRFGLAHEEMRSARRSQSCIATRKRPWLRAWRSSLTSARNRVLIFSASRSSVVDSSR
ncbi:hypothetical protein AB0F91_17555 [Amycolatopsis sp. NPDC023774]|uniref:hypothetical protein n=1 Tax=Amycolatopsis sp. NPDC023774 TaxID=3155015 RepID=UPI0033CBB493